MISQLGRYEIVSEIGQGAMGIVYKAKDPLIDRIVAIKTINLSLADDEKEEYEGRFYQEARAAGRLSHPNIVTVFDVGKSGDIAYIAMEFLQGRELRDILNDGKRLPVEQALDIVVQVAQGLSYAHEHNIVHRDVKPSNIMVVRDGHVKITDFGIARMESASVRTQTGMVLGSPKYMSPEQVTGKQIDQRSDIFSLGVMLYEILVGQVPFTGEHVNAIMYQILNTTPPPPGALNPEVPGMLNFIVAKALAKEVADRYQNAKEFAADLRACRDKMLRGAPAEAAKPLPGAQLPDAIPVRVAASDDESKPVAAGLSPSFDSSGATMRLAAMTSTQEDVEELSRTFKMELPTAGALKQAAQGTAKSTASSTIPLFEGRVPAKTDAAQKVEPAGNSGNLLLLGAGLLVLAGLVAFFVL
ncbi:MAG: serine/threonine protein kinase bacterial [Gallionellaceae bacterium]|nr:MAG: serine/threonine protein kinase bacterial [Gallionellaceae bacterium]